MNKKPIGQIGPLRVNINPNNATKSLQLVKFSGNKRENEDKILSIFRSEAERKGFKFYDIKPNPENHFDYTLSLPGGTVFLDLMEIVYHSPESKNKNPYNSGEILINNKDYAEQIVKNILKKSAKYQNRGSTPIHLLTYVTQWSFQLGQGVIAICQNYLRNRPHIFENIFFLTILDDISGDIRVLFPSPDREGLKITELENGSYRCLDLSKSYLIHKDAL